MLRPQHSHIWLIAIALFTGGCAAGKGPVTLQTAPAVTASAPAPPPSVVPTQKIDPVEELIAISNLHFVAGQRELQLGHLEMAKAEFNQALDVLLESPFGARTESRIREHFDRLVERISAYEITAMAQGDGFAEKKYEPATIDELLIASTFEVAPPKPATQEAVAADLESTAYDIDIPLNTKVLAFVELLSGRLKSFLEEGLSRGARFLPMIQDVFRAEGLPLDLAYVPLVESAFKPNALSRAKAKGMWQFMSGTALENGLQHDWYIDERAEPEKATRAAAKYLKTLYGMFGDWHLALASYNGGPGRIQRAIKRTRGTDFWKMSASSRYLPRETRDYVPLILASVIIARNPVQYGMNIQPFDAPLAFEKVTLPEAMDIRRVAEWAGTSVETIQDLNPELRRWTTPMRTKDYELKVPQGTAELVQTRLAGASPDELAPLQWHTVRKGETLMSIARKLSVSRADLAAANYLSVKSGVKPGQQLVIPRAPALLLAARADTAPPLTESRSLDPLLASNSATAIPADPADTVSSSRPEKSAQSRLVYLVKRGDTLFSIAKLYRTTVASLKTWNRMRGNALQVGQRLTIFAPRPSLASE